MRQNSGRTRFLRGVIIRLIITPWVSHAQSAGSAVCQARSQSAGDQYGLIGCDGTRYSLHAHVGDGRKSFVTDQRTCEVSVSESRRKSERDSRGLAKPVFKQGLSGHHVLSRWCSGAVSASAPGYSGGCHPGPPGHGRPHIRANGVS